MYKCDQCTYEDNSKVSNIFQADGNISYNSSSSVDDPDDISANKTEYETDDEVDPHPHPVNLFPIPGQNVQPGQPLLFDVDMSTDGQPPPSCLPLCLMMNCRSICNKIDNMREMLHTLGPSIVIASERDMGARKTETGQHFKQRTIQNSFLLPKKQIAGRWMRHHL